MEQDLQLLELYKSLRASTRNVLRLEPKTISGAGPFDFDPIQNEGARAASSSLRRVWSIAMAVATALPIA